MEAYQKFLSSFRISSLNLGSNGSSALCPEGVDLRDASTAFAEDPFELREGAGVIPASRYLVSWKL